ncbi:MAG: VWA domain-containing protein [Clostridiales bacterium]|nr:VWA domain-containing protein [Clostridiales bacterium]
MKNSAFIFLNATLVCFLCASAQTSPKNQASERHEVTVAVKLVHVYVSDNRGNPLKDLDRSEFELYDNGKAQPIIHFEKHALSLSPEKPEGQMPGSSTGMPSLFGRRFFLVFDFAFNTYTGVLKSKEAALHFLKTQLAPDDEVGVLSYSVNKGLVLHEYLTKDYELIRRLIESFGASMTLGRAESIESQYWREMKKQAEAEGAGELANAFQHVIEHDRGSYRNQVSVLASRLKELAKALRYISGQKHIIFFSGGVANFILYGLTSRSITGELESLPELGHHESGRGDSALRGQYENLCKELAASNSSVYAINTAGKGSAHFTSPDMLGDYSLKQLARLSGGSYYDNISNYKAILEDIQKRTGYYYVLGYTVEDRWDGKHHKIQVKTKRKGCQVTAQSGYYNPKPFPEWTEMEKMLQLLDLALSEAHHLQEPIHFRMEALPVSVSQETGCVLLAQLNNDNRQPVLNQKAEIVALIFDDKTNPVVLKRQEVNPGALQRENIIYSAAFWLPPGQYNCRLVIRNLITGKGAAASADVVIPRPDDRKIRIDAPLLLKSEKNTRYLESDKTAFPLFSVYPFDSSQFSPVIGELEHGIPEIAAVIRLSSSGLPSSEIEILASLVNLDEGEKIDIPVKILSQFQSSDTEIYSVGLAFPGVSSGNYSLHFFVVNRKNLDRYHATRSLLVKSPMRQAAR